MSESIISNLLSGLIGSLIGAIVGAWATLRASEKSLKGLYEQEVEKRKYESKKQNEVVLEALLKELKENLLIASDVTEKGNYKVKMSRESWNIFKGQISFMTKKLQGNLPFTYALVSNFNGLIDYDFNKIQHGGGYIDDKIISAAEKFKGNAGGVIAQLEDLLANKNKTTS